MSEPIVSQIKGNSRGCLIYEPLFLIPYSMFTTYATIYMYQLGVGETAIGWITTLCLAVQIISSLISGYLTDRMGRKWALLTFDLLSWSVATLLWAFSQNIWFFVAAAVVNGFQRIPHTALYCLLVEDTPPKHRTAVFSVLQFASVVGGLFAPLGGLLVSHYSLIDGVRIMYIIAFAGMTTQFIGRHFSTRETDIGLRKMRETRGRSAAEGLREYFGVIRSLVSSKPLLLIFGVYILFNFQMTMKGTYLSIYLVDHLSFEDWIISVFPAASSVVMLLIMWFVQPKIKERLVHRTMVWGFAISIASNVLLLIPQAGSIAVLTISTVLGAAGVILTSPYLEAVVANAIDDEHRANMFSMLSVLILVFTAPSGIIGGLAYRADPRIPFVLVTLSFVIIIALMAAYSNTAKSASAKLQGQHSRA
ncbi:MFS transporter [Paenibacillus thermotolerans]|uniref:MFS transporter n=1 Tax=Paenibacillus thermotolerans TaxID=3027807 RepID=UPI002368B4BC|nr:MULTISPECIES: MFS transporter [unclassified Paenibacillus]